MLPFLLRLILLLGHMSGRVPNNTLLSLTPYLSLKKTLQSLKKTLLIPNTLLFVPTVPYTLLSLTLELEFGSERGVWE